jgi:MFS family permease
MLTSSRSAVRRVALARLISTTGSEAAFTALIFTLYRRTGSSAWAGAGLFLTFGTVGFLSPIAGSLGDRFDRRRVMVVSDLAGALCFGALAFARSPLGLVALAFLAAAAETPFYSASTAAIPNLAGPDDVAWANGTYGSATNLGHLIGPFLGGAIVALAGAPAVFLGNAVSFALSAALVATVRASFSGHQPEADAHRGFRAGVRFMLHDPVLRTIALAFAVVAFSVGSVLVAELPMVATFRVGAIGYGLLGVGWGAGALLGSLGARSLTEATEPGAVLRGSLVTAAGFVLASLSPWFAPIVLAMLVCGCSDAVVEVAVTGIFQRRTPDEVRSRVIAALDAAFMATIACSFLLAGFVVGAIGARGAYAVAGAGSVATALILRPVLRPLIRRPDSATPVLEGTAGH